MDTSLIIIIANACMSGGYVLVKLGKAFISFGKSLKDPERQQEKINKKTLKLQKLQNKLYNEKIDKNT